MRILHIHSGNLYGGVERVLSAISWKAKACSGDEQHFALCFEGRLAEELRGHGAKLHILGAARASQPWSVWRARRRLHDLCQKHEFEMAMVHSLWSLAVAGPAAPRPLFLYQHDLFESRHGWLEHWARRNRPDTIIANSAYTASTTHHLFPEIARRVVHPPAILHAPRLRGWVRGPACVIVQASRFERWKGHELTLNALALLPPNLEWEYWIAGEPQGREQHALRASLETRATALGIAERVRFLGHVSDVATLLRTGDIYCQINTAPEPFGLAYVEALDAGLPVVASALGGALEILNDGCGFLLPPDASQVSAVLELLIANPELRRRIGANGAAQARRLCDPKTQIRALSAACESVAGMLQAA